ncbi:MAG: hypothetical protein GY804_12565 [Alphaproteobacteria bacterium]|nr:hypothetical protein [Alphaproteobacteria bacterium]
MNRSVLPSPESIRAARGYLDISQGELAEGCGLTAKAISLIEKKVHAKESTLETIRSFFWEKGIEFLPEGGFRPHDALVTVLEGDDGVRKFFLDVMTTAELIGGEFLVSGMDEIKYYYLLKKLNIDGKYRDNMDNMVDKITYRVLVSKKIKDQLIPPVAAPYCTYKAIPDDQISSNVPFYIYGHKLAIILNDINKVIVIKDSELVEAYKLMFDSVWNSRFAERVYTK